MHLPTNVAMLPTPGHVAYALVPTLAASWYVYVLAAGFLIVCLFMMLVILIQKPKGGGLSGAFGGGGGAAQSVMGAKTGEFLTWFTVGCFVAFLLLAMGLTWAINSDSHGPVVSDQVRPPASTTPEGELAPLTDLPEPESPAPSGPSPATP